MFHISHNYKIPVSKLCIPPLSEISMSNNQSIDNLLEEFEVELSEQKARLQEEIIAAITKHTKNREDILQKQIAALKREIIRINRIITTMPPCKCRSRPTPCNLCGKIFKTHRTRYQHSKNLHCMAEMSLNSQSHTADYQYANYHENGNGSSWSPHIPYPSFPSIANSE